LHGYLELYTEEVRSLWNFVRISPEGSSDKQCAFAELGSTPRNTRIDGLPRYKSGEGDESLDSAAVAEDILKEILDFDHK
jgi:hypothetical protein